MMNPPDYMDEDPNQPDEFVPPDNDDGGTV
jgi:hypothetical protein